MTLLPAIPILDDYVLVTLTIDLYIEKKKVSSKTSRQSSREQKVQKYIYIYISNVEEDEMCPFFPFHLMIRANVTVR